MIDDDTQWVDVDWTHVFPQEDTWQHVLVGTECWCNPEVDEDDMIVVHRCADQRLVEAGFIH